MTNREAIERRTPADEVMSAEESAAAEAAAAAHDAAWSAASGALSRLVQGLEVRPRPVDALAWLLAAEPLLGSHHSFRGVRKRWPGKWQKQAEFVLMGRMSIRQRRVELERDRVVWSEVVARLSADQQGVWRRMVEEAVFAPVFPQGDAAGPEARRLVGWLLGERPERLELRRVPRVLQRVLVFVWQWSAAPLWSHMSFADLGAAMGGKSREWATTVWEEVFSGTGVTSRAARGRDVREACAVRMRGRPGANRRAGRK